MVGSPMDYFKEDPDTTPIYRQFAMKYLRGLFVPLFIALAVTAALILLTVVFWPLYVGVLVEFGEYPWEYIFQSGDGDVLNQLPTGWYIGFGLWIVFGVTGLYAAASTLMEVASRD